MPILDRRYVLPVALALVFFTTFFVATEVRKTEMKEAAAQIWGAAERLRMLTDIRSLLTDAESGQRGFLLTGDRAYLAPFTQAKQELPVAIRQLRASYPETAQRGEERLTRLSDLTGSKLGELDQTIDLYNESGQSSALRVVKTDVGEHAMDELRSLIDYMRADERESLVTATGLWNHEYAMNTLIMGGGTVLNMLFVLLAGHLLTRDLHRRKSETARLETEVSARTRELNELSSHLQQISEAEKGSLARELHDELGGVLVAVKMDLSQLRRHLPSGNPEVEKRWDRIQFSLSEGIDLKRRVVEELRPTLLDNMGLSAALKWQLQESCGRAGLVCRDHLLAEAPRLSSDAAIAIFRIVQETLANIIKHAQAKSVDLALDLRNDALVIEVTDDGVGLPQERHHVTGFHGLTSMRQRVRTFGGELEFEPGELGRGTRVRISIPLSRIAQATPA